MDRMSVLLFVGGLRYNDKALAPGAQTERWGEAAPSPYPLPLPGGFDTEP